MNQNILDDYFYYNPNIEQKQKQPNKAVEIQINCSDASKINLLCM